MRYVNDHFNLNFILLYRSYCIYRMYGEMEQRQIRNRTYLFNKNFGVSYYLCLENGVNFQ